MGQGQLLFLMDARYPFTQLALALAGAFLFIGCSFPSSQPVVARSQTNVMHTLELGTVIAVRGVSVEGERTGLGGWGGAAIGAAAASPSDGRYGTEERLASAAAGVVGAVAGQAVEEVATREGAQEITIQLDSGRTVMITQETPDGLFQQGDRVQVAHGPGSALVRLALN